MSVKPRSASAPDVALRSLWRVRLAYAGLWSLLLLGGVGGVHALVGGDDAMPQVSAAGTTSTVRRDVGVAGFAELYVAAFLTAGVDEEAALRPYLPTPVDLSPAEPAALWAARTTAVDVRPMDEGYWAVTVAADVLAEGADGTYGPAGRRYFTVGVADTQGGLVATGLPSLVAAPPTPDVPDLAIDVMHRPAGELEPLSEALDGFFDAYLAGGRDLERYTAGGVHLDAVRPAPFTETTVRTLGTRPASQGAGLLARVEVVGTDTAGRALVLQYALRLVEHEGRWEVTDLLAAPPLLISTHGES
ncbi:MAG TPA: conjugal transfer protein [Nitriliruptorales bacterium]